VLDAGSGEGFLADELVRRAPGLGVTAVDVRVAALRFARERFGAHQPRIAAGICDLPFRNQAFDLVLCSEVLEHLEHPLEALRELIRVSARYVLITVPREPIFQLLNRTGRALRLCSDAGHIHFWTRAAFQREFAPFFTETMFRWRHTYQLLLGRVR
jgi:ubiquinone/menaquinone biosynthesis C-methylase UbiE